MVSGHNTKVSSFLRQPFLPFRYLKLVIANGIGKGRNLNTGRGFLTVAKKREIDNSDILGSKFEQILIWLINRCYGI